MSAAIKRVLSAVSWGGALRGQRIWRCPGADGGFIPRLARQGAQPEYSLIDEQFDRLPVGFGSPLR